MLSAHTLLNRDGVEIADVICRHSHGRGRDTGEAERHAIVFVRSGCFVRSADGVEHLLDPTRAYCINPGEEQRYDHPHSGGDDCTAVRLEADLLASLWADDTSLPSNPLPSSPAIDLEHRLLLAASRRGANPHELTERAISLTAAALEQADPERVASGRPATLRARRAVVDAAREALAADPDHPLPDLAAALGVSAHHLSRIFRAGVGHTISRHRMRLRVRAALEQLAGGERGLARLAAELGFVDQSHLCRVIRSETGHTPSALRQALRDPPPQSARGGVRPVAVSGAILATVSGELPPEAGAATEVRMSSANDASTAGPMPSAKTSVPTPTVPPSA